MHPLRNGSQATERPAAKPLTGSPGWFTESGDNNIPSYPGADWFNHVIAEFQNALAALGIPFVPGDDNHLADALKKINYKVFTFDYFADVISSELDLSSFLEVKTIQHSTDGLGGTTYIKDGTSGTPNTGNEAKFYDASGTGWINKSRNVTTFGPITDDIAISAQKAIDQFNCVYIPNRTDFIHRSSTISLKEGSVINADNPLVSSDGENFVTFILADDIKRWAILGALNYKGSLVTSEDIGGEIGLLVKGGQNYRVESFVGRNCRSHSVKIEAGSTASAPRGDQGQLVSCAGYECMVGLEVQPDTTAEFNQIIGFNTSGCQDGVVIGAGNTSLVGGNCVDNVRGVTVVGGFNHAHGICSSMNINHNSEYNIKCIDVVNGHTFDSCHAYGNGGTSSPIWFVNSKSVVYQNGKIDCPIYNDGEVGQNAILNNNMPGVDAQLLGLNPEMLRVLGNWTADGTWASNDAASEYTLVSRGGTPQSIPLGTTLVFNSAIKDKRTNQDLVTGVYTSTIETTLDVELYLEITGTFTENSYLELLVGADVFATIPAVMISPTLLVASAVISTNVAAGTFIKLVSKIPAGTSPQLDLGSQLRIATQQ